MNNSWTYRVWERIRNHFRLDSFQQRHYYVSPPTPPLPPTSAFICPSVSSTTTLAYPPPPPHYCDVINLMDFPLSPPSMNSFVPSFENRQQQYYPITQLSSTSVRVQPPSLINAPPLSQPSPIVPSNSYTLFRFENDFENHQLFHHYHHSPIAPTVAAVNEAEINLGRNIDDDNNCQEMSSKVDDNYNTSNVFIQDCYNRIDSFGNSNVIAFICGLIVIILMIMGLVSTDWLMAAGWRQGLFMHCIEEDAPTPLPFNMQEPPGCYQSRDAAYVKAAAALCVITLLTDVVATVLTGLGIRTKDHRTKYKYYRFAVLVMLFALISILIALVIYPVCFAAELNLGNRTVWEFGWAYGVGWGAAIFLFGGVILLLCDKESEEIYYKERKIVHDNDSRA